MPDSTGAITFAFGLGSKWLSASPFSPTLLALLVGIALGPELLNLINLEELGDRSSILEKAARLTLGVGLVGVALRIPRLFIHKNWGGMLILIGAGMVLMWAISTALVYFILGVSFWMAALLGAIITPTDPVAASPIVTGSVAERNLPERMRNSISFESGANDGLGYLLVFLPLLMLTRPPEEALSHWLLTTLLWHVVGATLFGLLLGYAAGKLLQAADRNDAIQPHWRLVFTVAVALLAIGVGRLLQSDEILVAFAAGAMFVQVVTREERENEDSGQEAVNRFFAIPIFVLLGAALPWQGWAHLGWNGVLLVVAVLLLRRPPVMLLLRHFLPQLHRPGMHYSWAGSGRLPLRPSTIPL